MKSVIRKNVIKRTVIMVVQICRFLSVRRNIWIEKEIRWTINEGWKADELVVHEERIAGKYRILLDWYDKKANMDKMRSLHFMMDKKPKPHAGV